jgi:hypothetical protein
MKRKRRGPRPNEGSILGGGGVWVVKPQWLNKYGCRHRGHYLGVSQRVQSTEVAWPLRGSPGHPEA